VGDIMLRCGGCTVLYIAGTFLERSEQTEKWKETKQIRIEFSVFITTQH
jgi:hypothetical protein